MLKLSDNPPMLFPQDAPLAEIAGQWWVARTKSRNEKALAWWLHQSSIAYFLPMREKTTRRKGRVFKSLLPLFSGYLFFSATEEQRVTALTSNRIAQLLEVPDQQQLLGDMTAIHDAISKGASLDPHPYLKQGDRCRVAAGPLAGLEGMLVRRKGVTRLVLQIDMLGQAAAAEVDADLVELIS